MNKLRLFHISDGQVERQPASLFQYEKELQDLLEQHLHDFLGVHFLTSEFATDSGFIDTLGIDDAGRPVIIEYKRGTDIKAIVQGLGYLRWLHENKTSFIQQVSRQLGREDAGRICWSPRLLIVAGEYRHYQVNAARIVPSIELLGYRRMGENGLILHWITGGSGQSSTPISVTLTADEPESATSRFSTLPDFGEFRFEGMMSDEAWALFRELLAFTQTLGRFRLEGLRTFLAFRPRREKDDKPVWPEFASVRPGDRSGIRIDVLERTQSRPPEEGFTSVDRSHRIIHVRSCADLEKAKPLLRDAWKNR